MRRPILFLVMVYFLYVDMVSGAVSAFYPPGIMRFSPGDKATETSS
jgi:hypothetical protein